MGSELRVRTAFVLVLLVIGCRAQTTNPSSHVAGRSFAVRDDIEMVQFVDTFRTALQSPIKYSPDGQYFAVVTERGLVEKNVVEDTVWVFSTSETTAALAASAGHPHPISLVTMSSPKAPAIYYIQWTANSKGLAFIAAGAGGLHQLFEVHLGDRQPRPLSDANHDVSSFDLQGSHVIYSAVSALAMGDQSADDTLGSITVGTGLDLNALVLGKMKNSPLQKLKSLCNLWTLVDGRSVMLEDTSTHRPILIHQRPNSYGDPVFRLSPDGSSVAAEMPAEEVPGAWEALPPGADLPPRRIKAGPQQVRTSRLPEPVNQYAVIDVASGRTRFLMNAPIGFEHSYYAAYQAISWASDSRSVVLANTFMGDEMNDSPQHPRADHRPCIAVVNVYTSAMTCALRLPATQSELVKAGLHRLVDVRFDGDDSRLVVDVMPERPDGGGDHGKLVYLHLNRNSDGTWHQSRPESESAKNPSPIMVDVEQTLNTPPRLVARDLSSKASSILLDPNEKMRELALGVAEAFHWEDKHGREWRGGLVKPPNYTPGTKYPLILQTHGFEQSDFLSSGGFPSCMAARELAGVGFVVLQMGGPLNESKWDGTPEEASTEVEGFDGAVDQLSRDGLVDPTHVGIIGFSRTVYGVLDALATGKTKYRAATVCDGMQAGYLEYLLSVDYANNEVMSELDALIGAPPYGKGLQTWLQRSPNFNLDKVTTPLMVQAFGALSTLYLWEPYAQLRLMKKPVDLIVVNTNDEQHVLSTPRARISSQGTDVDWFRFWLQGYERPGAEDPNQYTRWRHLRDLDR